MELEVLVLVGVFEGVCVEVGVATQTPRLTPGPSVSATGLVRVPTCSVTAPLIPEPTYIPPVLLRMSSLTYVQVEYKIKVVTCGVGVVASPTANRVLGLLPQDTYAVPAPARRPDMDRPPRTAMFSGHLGTLREEA